jgi:hypothetical protein
MMTMPAGITWERTGRQRWEYTVRRESETVYDIGHLLMLAQQQYSLASQNVPSASAWCCPCCGYSSLFGGALGFGL